MTRETKIGMIVAGSFLSLVGVVVGTKLFKRDLPSDNNAAAVAANPDPKKDPPPPGAAAPSSPSAPNLQPIDFRAPGTLPLVAPPSSASVDVPPPVPSAGANVATQLQETISKQEKDLHAHGDKLPNTLIPAIEAGNKGVADLGKQPTGNGFSSLPPLDNNALPVPPLAPPASPPLRVVAQGPDAKGTTTPPPAGFDVPPAPSAPTPPTGSSPNNVPPPPSTGTIPPVPTAPYTLNPAPPPTAPVTKDSTAAPPPAPIGTSPVSPPPNAPVTKDPPPPPPSFGSVPPPPPSDPTPPSAPSTSVPPMPFTSVPPTPIANVPPIVTPTAPTSPNSPVVVGDEKRYVVRPADSYASVSRTVYGDERYAAALEAYNRSRLGGNAPVTLQPGMEIVIPTTASLQNSRFGVLIAATAPPTVTPAPPPPPAAPTYPPIATSPAALAPAQPVPPAPPFPTPTPAVVPPSPPPPPLANRDPVTIGPVTSPNASPVTTPVPAGVTTYRIPAGGLLIAQVAQQQLGSPLRWIDIYRLNSNLDPSRPIPEGTDIRLPPR